jgi:hypothetical protein
MPPQITAQQRMMPLQITAQRLMMPLQMITQRLTAPLWMTPQQLMMPSQRLMMPSQLTLQQLGITGRLIRSLDDLDQPIWHPGELVVIGKIPLPEGPQKKLAQITVQQLMLLQMAPQRLAMPLQKTQQQVIPQQMTLH